MSTATPGRTRDFTLGKYAELCQALREAGYVGLGMSDYMTRAPGAMPERVVLLRHDVESEPKQAVRMGGLEHDLGLVATYFFRTKRSVLDPAAITGLSALGHEIGYHYETMGQAWGNVEQAVDLFDREIERLRRHAPVKVASMHGSPLLPWDNRDIWKVKKPGDFGLVGEVYQDVDYQIVRYYSDTGRTWHPTRFNVRDHAHTPAEDVVDTTDELMALVRTGRLQRLSLLTHCERWSETRFGWMVRAARDAAENRIKMSLARVYGLWRR